MTINFKNIYLTETEGKEQWVLIIYDISPHHYVGVPVYNVATKDRIYLKSINRYVSPTEISDYSRYQIINPVYIGGKVLSVNNKDFNAFIKLYKKNILLSLDKIVDNHINGVSYLKWCKDKFILSFETEKNFELKQGGIYWVNLGINIGSELRKLRPAILWRATGNKKLWTIIPLSSKSKTKKYYFHYKLEKMEESIAKVENLANVGFQRILSPYYIKGKLAFITKKDREKIGKAIKKYYLFED